MRRYHWFGFSDDQLICFQLFQMLDQHFFSNGGNTLPEIAVAFAAGEQLEQDDGLPVPADLFHYVSNGACLEGRLFIGLDGGAFFYLGHIDRNLHLPAVGYVLVVKSTVFIQVHHGVAVIGAVADPFPPVAAYGAITDIGNTVVLYLLI